MVCVSFRNKPKTSSYSHSNFVGKDLQSVLADTNQGTEFGGIPFTKDTPEVLDPDLARRLGWYCLNKFDDAIRAVQNGETESYFLGPPNH